MNIGKKLHLVNTLENEILNFIKTQLSNKGTIYINGIENEEGIESLDFLDKETLDSLPIQVVYEGDCASEFVLIGIEKVSDNSFIFIGLCQASELYDKDTKGVYWYYEVGSNKALELLSILEKENLLKKEESALETIYYTVTNTLEDVGGVRESDGNKSVCIYAMVDNKPLHLNTYVFDYDDNTENEINKCIDFGGHDDEDNDEYSKVMSDYINGRTSNNFELKIL